MLISLKLFLVLLFFFFSSLEKFLSDKSELFNENKELLIEFVRFVIIIIFIQRTKNLDIGLFHFISFRNYKYKI